MNSFEDFLHNQFEKLISPDDKIILIYSGIWSFAPRLIQDFKIPVRDFPKQFLSSLESFLGQTRTLVIPTYSFGFPKSKQYDKLLTKSDVGILSQETIGRNSFFRTNQAIYSYTIKGPHVEMLTSSLSTTAWGSDSIMGKFYQNDITVCTLGVPWEYSCSYIHSAEELTRVPYRYFKRFTGIMMENNQNQQPCQEVMYVRSLQIPADVDYTPATNAFEKEKLIRKSNNDRLPLQMMKAKALLDCTIQLLKKDPYAFVRNFDEVKHWEQTGKIKEIASLSLEQRYDL
ncbi:AAC(3) family N-acetyltransferase [Leptospira alstonii]|uniref:AAC(3) family N-acetyltransferase n=1 Tax=Leptospira alstonii TaxID=28452 RepID=UPI00138EFBC8|nr:AAC(3) family N-acetyltransferase [Leptospira alstonii]